MQPDDMKDETLREILKQHQLPKASERLKKENISESAQAFEKQSEKNVKNRQGLAWWHRLMGINKPIGEITMKKLYVTSGLVAMSAAGVGLVSAGLMTGQDLIKQRPEAQISAQDETAQVTPNAEITAQKIVPESDDLMMQHATPSRPTPPLEKRKRDAQTEMRDFAAQPAPPAPPMILTAPSEREVQAIAPTSRMQAIAPMPQGLDKQMIVPHNEGRDNFQDIEDNPVKLTKDEPVSTFSIDVDTSSYSFMRRQLNSGALPQPDSVRVEELINYFDYNYALPQNEFQPFQPNVALYTSPWNKDRDLLHIGIQGHDIIAEEKPRSNLVFLIDTSGSMSSEDKLPLLVNGFKMMVENLDPEDTVAIATYAGSAGVVLEPTKVKDKQTILSALSRLQSGGSTAGAAGIKLAYDLAQQHFDEKAINRVMLATDGDFNVGISNIEELKGYIERKRESGIFLSVLGFGEGNYNDHLMQTLAQNGNGTAAYIDTLSEARKVLVEEASSTLFPIAKDVKIQIEFNPAHVAEYRLIGYQTRKLNREDFNNDAVDAGEIGAGHSVTAIYEITRKGSESRSVDPLRYGDKQDPKTEVELTGELAFLKLRYKRPNENESRLIERSIGGDDYKSLGDCDINEQCFADRTASNDVRFATAVAAFGQKLRGGKYLNNYSYDDIIALAQSGKGDDRFGYRSEFINLVRLAKSASAM